MLLLVYISTYGIRRLVDDFCPGSATCLQSSHGKNEFNKCHCIFRTPSPTWSKPIKRLHTFQCELKPRKEPLRRRPGAWRGSTWPTITDLWTTLMLFMDISNIRSTTSQTKKSKVIIRGSFKHRRKETHEYVRTTLRIRSIFTNLIWKVQ